MKMTNGVLAVVCCLSALALFWVGAPAVFLLMGARPTPDLWRDLRGMTVGSLAGIPLGLTLAWSIRRIRAKRQR